MNVGATELRAWIASGEGRDLEFKRGLPRDRKTARSLCAFANTSGGRLLIGVTDRGEVYGVPRPREVIATLREICRTEIDPALEVVLKSVRLDDKSVVCCSVPLSPGRPHAILGDDASEAGEIVVRVGASNRRAQGATLEALRRPRGKSGLDPLQKRVLAWVEARSGGAQPGGSVTIRDFAKTHNIGIQRARRAFVQLEREGRLVGHGSGPNRAYGRP
jgi:hypothetical protein